MAGGVILPPVAKFVSKWVDQMGIYQKTLRRQGKFCKGSDTWGEPLCHLRGRPETGSIREIVGFRRPPRGIACEAWTFPPTAALDLSINQIQARPPSGRPRGPKTPNYCPMTRFALARPYSAAENGKAPPWNLWPQPVGIKSRSLLSRMPEYGWPPAARPTVLASPFRLKWICNSASAQ